MKGFLISFLIGALLAIIITSLFLQPRDDDSSIITEWKQLARDYQEGKLTQTEYVRLADKLIERGQNIPRNPCNRTWHTKPCGSK